MSDETTYTITPEGARILEVERLRQESAQGWREATAMRERAEAAEDALAAIAERVLVDGQCWSTAGLPDDVRRAMDQAEIDAEDLCRLRAVLAELVNAYVEVPSRGEWYVHAPGSERARDLWARAWQELAYPEATKGPTP